MTESVMAELDAASAEKRQPRSQAGGSASIAAVLEPKDGSWACRFAGALGMHPVVTFLIAILVFFAATVAVSIGLGFLITDVLLAEPGVEHADEWLPGWLAAHRSEPVLDASLVGSIIAGGVVLPLIAGTIALCAAFARRWRIAAFAVFVLAFESGVYRGTTLVVERRRPDVVRLETLPADASYPSGHTAAAIAVYAGLVLLLIPHLRRWQRVTLWIVAVSIPLFVAFARMTRGMHHPIDAAAGALIGIAAIFVLVFACRAAAHAGEIRNREQQT